MTTKHPISRLLTFVNRMSHTFSEDVDSRLDLYLDYVSELEPEQRVEMYNSTSELLNQCFPPDTTITRTDLIHSIPDRWPCSEWFEANDIDISVYENPSEVVAVFDYHDIITSFNSVDHKRLVMLLILDAVKSTGNDRCNIEMQNLKNQIDDDGLLSEYGYGGSAELFDTAKEIISEFTPTGSSILMDAIEVYNAGDGSMGGVMEHITNVLLEEGTIPAISREVSQRSNEIAKDPNRITENITKIAKAAGMNDEITDLVKDVSIEVIADPNGAFDVITSHASNITGIDSTSIRGVVDNLKKAIPTEEINEMAQTVTESFEQSPIET